MQSLMKRWGQKRTHPGSLVRSTGGEELVRDGGLVLAHLVVSRGLVRVVGEEAHCVKVWWVGGGRRRLWWEWI